DLYSALGGYASLTPNDGQPIMGTNGIKIYSEIINNELEIFVGDAEDLDTNNNNGDTCSITISDPNNYFQWSNYGNTWTITNVQDLTYDIDAGDGTSFTFLATINANGNMTEVVFYGDSCANLGN